MQPNEAPSGKGKRVIVLHTGGRDRFVKNCADVFVTGGRRKR